MTRLEQRARARAFQALYAWEVRDDRDLLEVAEKMFDLWGVGAEERVWAQRLLGTLKTHISEIDEELGAVTDNWKMSRIGLVERAMLRLGASEMRGATPVRVVLAEYVRLADRYGAAGSGRFVNGVLDAYARRVGVLVSGAKR